MVAGLILVVDTTVGLVHAQAPIIAISLVVNVVSSNLGFRQKNLQNQNRRSSPFSFEFCSFN